MKRLLFAILMWTLAVCAYAQGGFAGQGYPPILYSTVTTTGSITASSTNCLGVAETGCVYLQLPPNASTSTVILTGTWSATIQLEITSTTGLNPATIDSGTWTVVAPVSANGTYVMAVGGQTWIRVRCSAFTSGTVTVSLNESTNPAEMPGTISIQNIGAGLNINYGFMNSTVQTATVTAADWTCGTGGTVASCVSAQTIGTLSFTLPLSAQTWSFICEGVVGQATGATANTWSVQTATTGATNVTANYIMGTAATAMAVGAVTDQTSSTTAFSISPAWTLGGTATKMPFQITGTVEGAAAAGTVINIQLTAPTVADLVTIYRGAFCRVL